MLSTSYKQRTDISEWSIDYGVKTGNYSLADMNSVAVLNRYMRRNAHKYPEFHFYIVNQRPAGMV